MTGRKKSPILCTVNNTSKEMIEETTHHILRTRCNIHSFSHCKTPIRSCVPTGYILHFFVILNHIALHLLAKHVDMGFGKFPRAYAFFEQHIQLCERPGPWLGDTEVSVDDTAEADAAPEETGKVTPVPRGGVQHVRCQHVADYGDHVVENATQDDCLDLETTRRQFRDERIGDGADGELVEERPHDHHATSGQGALIPVAFGYETQESHDHEHGAEAAETPEIKRSSADAKGHESPGTKDTDHVDGVLAHGEGVRMRGGEAGLFEKVRRVVGEGVAAEVLDGPDHAHDLGSA